MRPGGGEFCCSGCARVHEVLSGLDEHAGQAYLEAARRLGIVPGGDESPAPNEPLPPDPEAEREERFFVDGMMCPSCAWVVEQLLGSQPGVRAARFEFLSGAGTLRYDLRQTSATALHGLLAPLGYELRRVEDEQKSRLGRGLTFRFVAAAVITMNLMSLAVLRYAHDLGWMDQAPRFLLWTEFVLCLPVMWLGWVPAVRRAVSSLRARRPGMDVLIALSVGAAFVLSVAALLASSDQVYFETAAGLVTVSLLGRMIEARLRERAFRETAALMRLESSRVRVPGPDGADAYRPVSEVARGDRVLLRADEIVPFDGVAEGELVHVSEAVLTGEPAPIAKRAGDPVVAGSLVLDGELCLSVTRSHSETALRRIVREIEQSLQQSESRLQSADVLASWFVPLVVLVALGAWFARLGAFGLAQGLSAAGWFPSVAVLAVACPCAFSLAGVAAVAAATGALARRGTLVRDSGALERIGRVQTVIFDKTGTLTEGRLEVERIVWTEGERTDWLPVVLALEAGATHPVARSIHAHLTALQIEPTKLTGPVEDVPGRGRATMLDGRRVAVGARGLFPDAPSPAGAADRQTLVWFGFCDEPAGCLLLGDVLRGDAPETVHQLQRLGLAVEILTGDRQPVADQVRAALGARAARGGVSLEEKVTLVGRRAAGGEPILYVGDGTNDALAMREATASVSLACSTDEALTAASFVATHGRLTDVPLLVLTGRKLARVVRTNYLWAFGFNGLFVPVAAAGWLTPLLAMLLMVLSSATVLTNSLRLRSLPPSTG